jgi:hypothetical protein
MPDPQETSSVGWGGRLAGNEEPEFAAPNKPSRRDEPESALTASATSHGRSVRRLQPASTADNVALITTGTPGT